MAKTTKRDEEPLYLGVDVGATKILAGLVQADGNVLTRKRLPTPRNGTPEETLEAICLAMEGVLAKADKRWGGIDTVGLAVPGVVEPDEGAVVVTPNMNLSGLEVVAVLEERFGVDVVLGNDANLGTLGETWLGAARNAHSAVGIFVGTGIGGGLVIDGKLVRGYREAAGEIGHIVMQPGGLVCGCGNRGCFETLASRLAIEREIRKGIAKGRQTIITQLVEDADGPIKGKVLKKALKQADDLVTEVMSEASKILGYACLSVRHLIDPEVIVLGGGVIEACDFFIMPIVEEIVAADALPGARAGGRVLESELGDDAILLGAVALALGFGVDGPVRASELPLPDYPRIEYVASGEVSVGGRVFKSDIYIRGDGKVKKRNVKTAKQRYETSHKIGPEELEKVCKGRPDLVIIGTGHSAMVRLTKKGEAFLRERNIRLEMWPTPEALRAYNRADGRKAALIHVTC